MNIAITICATKNYAYAMTAQARRVQSACSFLETGHIILSGDDSKEINFVEKLYKKIMPKWTIHRVFTEGLADNHKNYKEAAQLLIGQLRTAAFTEARTLNVDYCWSLDSDVLPLPKSLECMLWSLKFDDEYYSIATCPYPSQGGGGFLGGRGTYYNHILPDFTEEERKLPEELKTKIQDCKKVLSTSKPKTEEEFKKVGELQKEMHELYEKAKKYPPLGNVFELNAKFGWRPRGWLEFAYPAIGKGSIVPSDWCGFGCTLLTKKALAVAHFDGYQGKGTEDLYIVWNRWFQEGLRINVIPHAPADHVIRNPGKPKYYVLQQAYHQPDGDCAGHLRIRSVPFYSFDMNEKYDPLNDGKIVHVKEECEKGKDEDGDKNSVK